MIGKEKIKFIRSLHQKKFRQKYNKFIAEGAKIVSECIAFAPEQIINIYGTSSYLKTLKKPAGTIKEKLIEIEDAHLKKISALDNPAQVLAVMEIPALSINSSIGNALYLDAIQIPNNVGAVLRIAEWYGINDILISPNTADIYSPKVVQASMGSFLRLKFHVIAPEDVCSTFPNHRITVADGGGSSLSNFEFSDPTILVMGNEGHGPSETIKGQADHVVAIDRISPIYPESLNVAVATGIFCHSWLGK